MLFFKRKTTQHHSLQATNISPIHSSEGYLQGQLLVSTPLIHSSCFHKSVIYLFAHNDEGAMGVILNQPMETVDYSSLLEGEDNIPGIGKDEDVAVYYGGPVDRQRGFVVHSGEYTNDDVLYRGNQICISANTAILKDMMLGRGPNESILCVGYSGWSPGQLEKEIEENSWITVPATPELVFDIDNDMKWAMASQSLGIDMNFFSLQAGHA